MEFMQVEVGHKFTWHISELIEDIQGSEFLPAKSFCANISRSFIRLLLYSVFFSGVNAAISQALLSVFVMDFVSSSFGSPALSYLQPFRNQ